MMGRQRGFTIIEVMLFLAISALLFLIALSYMSSTIRDVRFQDATKGVESFIERQYSAVQTNSVTRPQWTDKRVVCSSTGDIQPVASVADADSHGNSATCVLLGAEIVFEDVGTTNATRIRVFPILGYSGDDRGQGALESLERANPKVLTESIPEGADVYELPWDASLSKFMTPSGSYNAVAILRSPTSEAINVIYHDVPTVSNISSLNLKPLITSPTQRNLPAALCITSPDTGDMRGAVVFDGKAGSYNFSISSISSTVQPKDTLLIPDQGIHCNT